MESCCVRNGSLCSSTILTQFRNSGFRPFVRHLKARTCLQHVNFVVVVLLQLRWPIQHKLLLLLFFFLVFFCIYAKIHQVWILVFNSYQMCPVPLTDHIVPKEYKAWFPSWKTTQHTRMLELGFGWGKLNNRQGRILRETCFAFIPKTPHISGTGVIILCTSFTWEKGVKKVVVFRFGQAAQLLRNIHNHYNTIKGKHCFEWETFWTLCVSRRFVSVLIKGRVWIYRSVFGLT